MRILALLMFACVAAESQTQPVIQRILSSVSVAGASSLVLERVIPSFRLS